MPSGMHYFEQLFHAEEGWLSATCENMALHVDLGGEKDGRRFPRPSPHAATDEGRTRARCRCRRRRPAHRDAEAGMTQHRQSGALRWQVSSCQGFRQG